MKRNILCFETAYDKQHENRSTVAPVLELLERVERVRTIHFSCNTRPEWEFNLSQFDARSNFHVFYYAGHGKAQTMSLANGQQISLDELAGQMCERFAGWTVHLSGCEILQVSTRVIRRFMDATGVMMVTGYTEQVEWISGVALDLLWLSALQGEGQPTEIWAQFRKDYAGLIRSNGMVGFGAN